MGLENLFWMFGSNDWVRALITFFISFFIFELIKGFVVGVLKKYINNGLNFNLFHTVTKNIKNWFLLWLSIFIGSQFLELNENLLVVRSVITLTVVLLQGGFLLLALVDFWIERKISTEISDGGEKTTLSLVNILLKIAVWVFVILIILDNIPGVEITTLIAGLGIGGIAIGLAVQNILSDLFSSLSIALDKPFVIGDTIKIGDFTGTVEQIGLKSTRLRSLSGEQLIFSNSDLLASRIQNFKRMERRRVVFTIRVAYETPLELLEKIPTILEEILTTKQNITFEGAHFKEFGTFSLNFEVVYFIETSDYRAYMDIQQEINLEIFKKFNESGIVLAYSTQTIIPQSR